MKTIYNKIAAVLAFLIGGMAITSGMQTLLGKLPDYYVINWLPVYNYTVGILTVFVTAILIWINGKLAWSLAISTISLHALVMIILQTAYQGVVAAESTRAMTIRLITWGIILIFLIIQRRSDRRIVTPASAISPGQ